MLVRLAVFIKWNTRFPLMLRILADCYIFWHYHKSWPLKERWALVRLTIVNKHPFFYRRRWTRR